MKKKNNWHGSNTGKTFEDRICKELDELGIEYTREKIAHSKATAKTRRGKFDIRLHSGMCLELKTTGKKTIDYCLYAEGPRDVKIPGHQLTALYKEYFTKGNFAGLLIEFRPHKPIYIAVFDFYKWVIANHRKSINRSIALSIGVEIEHIKEIV